MISQCSLLNMDQLPTEIILAIINEIPNFQDRLRLVQVSWPWRVLFVSIAFRSTHIEWLHLRCLLGAALGNLAIRSSIREITVTGYVQRDVHVTLCPAIRDLVDLISESPVEWEEWCKKLSVNRAEAWIALLLAILPNLIAISAIHKHPEGWITRIMSKATWKQPPFDRDTLPALQRLERIDLIWCDLSRVLNHCEYLPFFHLPSLRTLRLGPVQESHSAYKVADHPAFLPPPSTSPIESLVLDYFCNGRQGMTDFITSCANLKRFAYQHTNLLMWCSYQEELDFARLKGASFRPWCFHAALLTQKHSLEVLHLNHLGEASVPSQTVHYDKDADPISHNRWFGSLANFPKLWDLRIRASNLLNLHPKKREDMVMLKDILPGSLKYLQIADCDEDICDILVPNLEDLLAQREERFPLLQSLIISPAPENPDSSAIRIQDSFRIRFIDLQRTCGRVGVQLFLGSGEKMDADLSHWRPGTIAGIELSG
ncbi:hypothetical protein BDV59DRAFT_182521 [Aspergillus ambiguus]|uniref:uncharacterized protein n=1 Tax=Aspergillus ambiguus TaxID=176160 RepID=UPI003CCCA478